MQRAQHSNNVSVLHKALTGQTFTKPHKIPFRFFYGIYSSDSHLQRLFLIVKHLHIFHYRSVIVKIFTEPRFFNFSASKILLCEESLSLRASILSFSPTCALVCNLRMCFLFSRNGGVRFF